jgi:hypothetical protein
MKTPSITKSGAWRSRWAALGAAVAVTLGAGGLVAVNAASSAPSSFTAITPVRILDTRTGVGLSGPFESEVARTMQVTGTVPTQPANNAPAVNAEAVPSNATSVVFNVTVLKPSTKGYISIRPGDAVEIPATSNINWDAGGPNTANSVTVRLPADGKINAFVKGTVDHVLIDVVGYHVPATSAPASEVTFVPFEEKMSFGDIEQIAVNGDMSLTLRCREDDTNPDQNFSSTNRNNMQFRARSNGEYMTTYDDAQDLYSNEGVTIARALGSSLAGTMVQTTFVTRDGVRTGATMTGADGSQITVDGDSVQVMFNVDNETVTGGGDSIDCYARGIAMLLPPR